MVFTFLLVIIFNDINNFVWGSSMIVLATVLIVLGAIGSLISVIFLVK